MCLCLLTEQILIITNYNATFANIFRYECISYNVWLFNVSSFGYYTNGTSHLLSCFPFVPKSLTEMWGDKKTQSIITKAFCQHVVYETFYLKFPAGTWNRNDNLLVWMSKKANNLTFVKSMNVARPEKRGNYIPCISMKMIIKF